MVKRKAAELEGAALDWTVAYAVRERVKVKQWAMTGEWWPFFDMGDSVPYPPRYHPGTNWKQGGPLIERFMVEVSPGNGYWAACIDIDYPEEGKTPLIAAMRAIVVAELGDEVEIPEELA